MDINSVDVEVARTVENEPMGGWKGRGLFFRHHLWMGTIFLASFASGADNMYSSHGYIDTRRWEKPLSKINDGSTKLIPIFNDLPVSLRRRLV